MGLNVFLRKGNHDLTWSNEIMHSFPFEIATEKYPEYGSPYDGEEDTIVTYREQKYIGEITGMFAIGSVTFQAKGYSYWMGQADCPLGTFYSDFSPQDVGELAQWFKQFLAPYEGQEDIKVFHEPIERIRWLAQLIEWMDKHKLGTKASY